MAEGVQETRTKRHRGSCGAHMAGAGEQRHARDPFLQSERTQGFAADPLNVKGEVFAYVGLSQNLKDLKRQNKAMQECGMALLLPVLAVSEDWWHAEVTGVPRA